jgi:hypothetical protein
MDLITIHVKNLGIANTVKQSMTQTAWIATSLRDSQ